MRVVCRVLCVCSHVLHTLPLHFLCCSDCTTVILIICTLLHSCAPALLNSCTSSAIPSHPEGTSVLTCLPLCASALSLHQLPSISFPPSASLHRLLPPTPSPIQPSPFTLQLPSPSPSPSRNIMHPTPTLAPLPSSLALDMVGRVVCAVPDTNPLPAWRLTGLLPNSLRAPPSHLSTVGFFFLSSQLRTSSYGYDFGGLSNTKSNPSQVLHAVSAASTRCASAPCSSTGAWSLRYSVVRDISIPCRPPNHCNSSPHRYPRDGIAAPQLY
jgi:hypothetical protein